MRSTTITRGNGFRDSGTKTGVAMPAPKELDASASLAALYGAKLRKLRLRAGMTQRQLGDQVPIAHSRIAQFELGNESPPGDVCRKLDTLLAADGDLIDLWGHVKRTPFPDWVQAFMTYEARAVRMRKFSQLVPGLAQTEAYARAVLQAGRIYDDGDPEEKVAARLERQALLSREAPPWVSVILDEAVLYRIVGSREVMRNQLTRLLLLEERSRFHLQVLSLSNADAAAMGGSFTLSPCLTAARWPTRRASSSGVSSKTATTYFDVQSFTIACKPTRCPHLRPRTSSARPWRSTTDAHHLPHTGHHQVAEEQLQQRRRRRLHRGGRRCAWDRAGPGQ